MNRTEQVLIKLEFDKTVKYLDGSKKIESSVYKTYAHQVCQGGLALYILSVKGSDQS